MIHFRPEWQEAPGVKDVVLARTWARLEIQARDQVSEKHWPSNLISPAESVQRGIYGSVFPLAEWVVENWWFLLHESCRVPELPSGRTLAKDPHQRPWVQRHNILAAREGGALPDLAFYRDGRHVVARWFSDPDQDDPVRPVRFFTAGESRLSPTDAEHALHNLVEEVLARLDTATDEDTARLRDNWRALCQSRQTESDLCSWAAQLGVDPYDPSALSDELINNFESKVKPLTDDLRADLLQACTMSSLTDDINWVNLALRKGDLEQPSTAPRDGAPSPNGKGSYSAHGLGYQRAERFRKEVNLPAEPVSDIAEILHAKCGWPKEPEISLDGAGNRLSALVGKDRKGLPRVIGGSCSPNTQRFRLARAMYFVPPAGSESPPRLVTKAYTWDQRASRAFAAELLAPAEALRAEVDDDGVPHYKVEELAKKFQVSSWVIERQLKNHRIGWTEEF